MSESPTSAVDRDFPLISVIIPTYYRNELLEAAIESVLNQTYDRTEIIVVDDSGEGNAMPVLDKYADDIQGIVHNQNGGDVTARQTGFEASGGTYVNFLDDDDVLLPEKLSKTASILAENDEVGVAFCGVRQDDGWECEPGPEMSGHVIEQTLRFETFPCYTGSMLIRRRLLSEILPLQQLTAGNDSNLMIELAQRTQFDAVEEPLVYNRRESSGIWVGLNRFDGMREVLEAQREIYAAYPQIRRAVKARIEFLSGAHRLKRSIWSAAALGCFARAAYYGGDDRRKHTLAFLSAIFGRPGFTGAIRAQQLLDRA
ncbi:glycosyltransferase family 2 protein [Halalkalirubrum salinum]|uniref:glycosyltransferase family 2 protein n=1 Tax=Halalkalirubrum salinum TaxID=2563889 RepID=UPI0010FB4409|nr:glycosyltransferase family 2 protein [Halalkalirubrum salinum]